MWLHIQVVIENVRWILKGDIMNVDIGIEVQLKMSENENKLFWKFV